jgi:hypothetical protein
VDLEERAAGLATDSTSAIEARSASATAIDAEQNKRGFAEPPACEIRRCGLPRTSGAYHSMLPLAVTNRDLRIRAFVLSDTDVILPNRSGGVNVVE